MSINAKKKPSSNSAGAARGALRETARKLRVLFDINHPADVHQFSSVVKILESRGHTVRVVARDKDCTFDLLHYYNIPFVPRRGFSGWKKIPGIFAIDYMLLKEARRFKADVLVGSSGNLYVAHVGRLLGKPSLVIDDTEHSKVQNLLTFPFATRILTPDTYSLDLGKKHMTYRGFKELAYCSPDYFRPKKTVLKKLGLNSPDRYFIIRLVAWSASHDIGEKRLFDVKKTVRLLEQHGKVFISHENPESLSRTLRKYLIPLEPAEFLDALYFARLVVSEGGTTAAEAACLGTPVVYANPLMPGYLRSIIKSSELIKTASSDSQIKSATDYFLSADRTRTHYRKLAQKLAESSSDINLLIADTIEDLALNSN
ncbi:DUF354 domain-containing protein [Candidatus Woesearchaeota archaeon]|nr:MAG: DUF354 domain-containing protein [Candidatus Woesearchaeota archaeon]